MNRKVLIFAFGLLLVFSLYQTSQAQKICDGKQLFTEKNCAGDTPDTRGKKLFRLINEYRAQNNLPAPVLSDALSIQHSLSVRVKPNNKSAVLQY